MMEQTPFLPKGIATFGVHDWNKWEDSKILENFVGTISKWENEPSLMQTRLQDINNTLSLCFLLSELNSYTVSLAVEDDKREEGFFWSIHKKKPSMLWGSGACVGFEYEILDGQIWDKEMMSGWILKSASNEMFDGRGFYESIFWFMSLSAYMNWHLARKGGRKGAGTVVGGLDLGFGVAHDVYLTGARFGVGIKKKEEK